MTHYKTLGIEKTATDEEIKKAYRKLAMKHHPDRNKDNPKSEEEFKKIGEAYSILSDPKKKKEYDNSLNNPFSNKSHSNQNPFGAKNPYYEYYQKDIDENDWYDDNEYNEHISKEHIDEFLRSMYEKDSFNSFREQTYHIDLTFWEAAFGVAKNVTIPNSRFGNKTIKINFPAGVNENETMEFTLATGESLSLRASIAPDPYFTRDNLDLYTAIELPFITAILGGKIKFPHWEKEYEVTVPAGIQNGQKLRLSNAGIKKGMFNGDLYIKCNISIPKKVSKEQQELLKQYETLEPKNENIYSYLKNSWNKYFKK